MIHEVHLISKDDGKRRVFDKRIALRTPIHQVEFGVASQLRRLIDSHRGFRKRESSLSFLEGDLRCISALRGQVIYIGQRVLSRDTLSCCQKLVLEDLFCQNQALILFLDISGILVLLEREDLLREESCLPAMLALLKVGLTQSFVKENFRFA